MNKKGDQEEGDEDKEKVMEIKNERRIEREREGSKAI